MLARRQGQLDGQGQAVAAVSGPTRSAISVTWDPAVEAIIYISIVSAFVRVEKHNIYSFETAAATQAAASPQLAALRAAPPPPEPPAHRRPLAQLGRGVVLGGGNRGWAVLTGGPGGLRGRVPRCSQGPGGQYRSAGPDVNGDRRADCAVGGAQGRRAIVRSGRDGEELLAAPSATEVTPGGLGPGLLMTPDLAQDGFPDIAAPSAEGNRSVVVVISANDGHRQGEIPLVYDGAPVPLSEIRVQYVSLNHIRTFPRNERVRDLGSAIVSSKTHSALYYSTSTYSSTLY